MAKTSANVNVSNPTGMTELTHVFKPGSPIIFEDGYHHYIHPGALAGVEKLNIHGLKNAEIYFLTPLSGYAILEAAYREDSGVLNLVDCENVVVSGLEAENRREFSPANIITESSNVVNVARSTVKFANCEFISNGKICFQAHSGSTVEIEKSILRGYYFELMNGASSLTLKNCEIYQKHPDQDSHSMLFTSSRHRNAIYDTPFENGHTIIDTCKIDMKSGRSLVSGNGSYNTRSNVTFRNVNMKDAAETFGVCSWHTNYNSITVNIDENTQKSIYDGPLLDYVETPNMGFGRFVNYYGEFKDSIRPGGVLEAAPIVVGGVSSKDV